MVLKAVKMRIYPNSEQRDRLMQALRQLLLVNPYFEF